MTTTDATYAREISYDRSSRDYAMYLDGELVGFARTYHEAEITLDELVFELLSSGATATATQLDGGSDVDECAADIISTPVATTDREGNQAYEITVTYGLMPLRYRLHAQWAYGVDCRGAFADSAPTWYGTDMDSLNLPNETIKQMRLVWESLFSPPATDALVIRADAPAQLAAVVQADALLSEADAVLGRNYLCFVDDCCAQPVHMHGDNPLCCAHYAEYSGVRCLCEHADAPVCTTCNGERRIPAGGWGDQAGGWAETCPDCGGQAARQRCLLCGGDHSAENCPRIHPIDAAALLHEADAVIGRLYCPLCLGNHLLRDCPLKHGDHATEADVLLSQTASHPGPDCSCPDCTRAAERLIIDAFMTRLRFDAGVLCSFCYPNHAEAEANARLISAAPELLAACEAAQQCITDFLDVYTRGCSMQVLDLAVRDLKVDALRRIKAALEKATA